jgi:hypothetical protein
LLNQMPILTQEVLASSLQLYLLVAGRSSMDSLRTVHPTVLEILKRLEDRM